MSCPYCGSENYLNEIAVENVLTYGGYPLTASLCCKQPLRVRVKTEVTGYKVETEETLDSWGNEFSKPSLVGSFALVKSGLNLTTATIHKIVKDDPTLNWIETEKGLKFNRSSILITGSLEKIELAILEYNQIMEERELAERNKENQLTTWLKKHENKK